MNNDPILELKATDIDQWHRLCAARILYLQRRDATHWYRMVRQHMGVPEAWGAKTAAACDAWTTGLDPVQLAHLNLIGEQLLEEKRR